ncbi:hypothetical protein MC7420_68 [Coleofasciculus chthonoplastes PCC 7420]|uniref:Uncharacterized protein n=1 Tax=Coleofasciculus chthonoplastes PCC 7420 TaxID=118168 RepID=B4W2X4_9CYAN|nr:hypothetical protein MC7420_68 [Coleofasciculus chthonoplastes PCC 7420]
MTGDHVRLTGQLFIEPVNFKDLITVSPPDHSPIHLKNGEA